MYKPMKKADIPTSRGYPTDAKKTLEDFMESTGHEAGMITIPAGKTAVKISSNYHHAVKIMGLADKVEIRKVGDNVYMIKK